MQKQTILEELRKAKAAHINWVQKAKLLISGFKIDEDAIPVNATQCHFGQWFYSDAQRLNGLRTNPLHCMERVEKLHTQLHDIYLNIYKIYYDIEPQGLLSRLFGKKKSTTKEATARAQEYFNEMERVSKELINELNMMERRIIVLPEEELAGL